MKNNRIIWILLCLLYACQPDRLSKDNEQFATTARDFTEVIDNDVKNINVTATRKMTSEYGGGDVCGVKMYYYNPDSTLLKIVNEYGSGEYGFTKERFYLKSGMLIFLERLTSQINFERMESEGVFDIHHEKMYFQTLTEGMKLERNKAANSQYDTLFTGIEFRKTQLIADDYDQELAAVRQIESLQLLDEE